MANYRFAYIKPNNAVRELKRMGIPPKKIPEGGPEAYVAHFLSVTKKNPSIIISTHNYPPFDEKLACSNVIAYSFYYGPNLKRGKNKVTKNLNKLIMRISVCFKIFFRLIKFRPNSILCWASSFSLWTTYLVSKILSIPITYSRHNRLFRADDVWHKKITGAIDRYIIRRTSFVIVHGPYLKEQMLKININSKKIIEFNWSFKHFLSNQEEDDISFIPQNLRQKKIILFIGRLEERKGIFDLLEACKDILIRFNECALIYAGFGSEFDKLTRAIKELELENSVISLGMIPHEKLPSLIKLCYVLVTPTRSKYPEGRCMATMEGLVMGRPVIVPNFGPFPFLVKNNVNGLLFKPDSITDLQKKVAAIINDSDLYSHLKTGAEKSSNSLISAPVNFSKAFNSTLIGNNFSL